MPNRRLPRARRDPAGFWRSALGANVEGMVRALPAASPLLLWALVAPVFGPTLGCSGGASCPAAAVETDQDCRTALDCVEKGFTTLSCVSGRCARACLRDQDCDPEGGADPAATGCGSSVKPTFICESQVCVRGCPDAPCGDGETCIEGRCAFFFESFELPAGQDVVTPRSLGWNESSRELENRETQIVFAGAEGCVRGDERCAGPAAHGVRFVSLERVPTPERGTPTLGVTCRACACCLECRMSPPARAEQAMIPSCPGAIETPAALMCSDAIPSVCQGVCDACEQCALSSESPVGAGLLACEEQAARRTCSSCASCAPQSPCPACFYCRDAVQCELNTPGSAQCRQLEQQCDAQGTDGCFSTPIARPRSQLTEDEQALESKRIETLAGQTGRIVIQLEYVPFDIREEYRRVVQGRPPAEWPRDPQEVVVQLCGGGCDAPESWVDGLDAKGNRAAFPPLRQRRNGLSFAGQSSIDWRGNRVEVDIPTALRTAEFRFRFVPRLENDARIGLDNIFVRRRP